MARNKGFDYIAANNLLSKRSKDNITKMCYICNRIRDDLE